MKKKLTTYEHLALLAIIYMNMYLLGRCFWCLKNAVNLFDAYVTGNVSGKDSFLFSWLLTSRFFWFAMIISLLYAGLKKYKTAWNSLGGFIVVIVLVLILF